MVRDDSQTWVLSGAVSTTCSNAKWAAFFSILGISILWVGFVHFRMKHDCLLLKGGKVAASKVAYASIGSGKYGSSSMKQTAQTAMTLLIAVIAPIGNKGNREESEICLVDDRLNKVGAAIIEETMRLEVCHPFAKFLPAYFFKSSTNFMEGHLQFGDVSITSTIHRYHHHVSVNHVKAVQPPVRLLYFKTWYTS